MVPFSILALYLTDCVVLAKNFLEADYYSKKGETYCSVFEIVLNVFYLFITSVGQYMEFLKILVVFTNEACRVSNQVKKVKSDIAGRAYYFDNILTFY